MYTGPNIITTGLVYGYDTGIGTSTNNVATRLYPGDPTTNSIPNASTFGGGWATYGSNDGTFITEFGTTGYQILNRLSWNGIYQNFNLGSAGNYTFSAWFKYLGGAANNNGATVYISNYGGGDTAAGLNKSLVGVWQRVSITVNVTAPGNVYFYLISYGGGGDDRSTWQVTMPQAELGTILTPFVNGTRSTTEALIDAKRATTIDLSTVSFNSSAQPIFDGTDDYINLPQNIQSGFTQASYMFVCKPSSLPSGTYRQLYIQESSTWIALYNFGGATFFGIDLHNVSGWFDGNGGFNTGARTTSTLVADRYYHVAYSWNGSNVSVYLNGSLEASVSTLQASNGRQNVTTLGPGTTSRNIGSRYSGGGNNWIGEINAVMMYNRALSSTEVTQAYNAYRARFNF